MRILISNWSCRRAGGTETYLGRIMSRLTASGHEVCFCFEVSEPERCPLIPVPPGVLSVQLRPDVTGALDKLRTWSPDVIYAHGFLEPEDEARVLDIAPGVLAAHSYYGTCISGEKTHKFPIVRPCSRQFGPACLALYFPRRCGGLSPITMMTAYGRQRRRLALLHRYVRVVTASAHMAAEFVRHGVASARVSTLPHYGAADEDPVEAPSAARVAPGAACRVTFIGRMDRLKGGQVLLDALPRVRAESRRPLQLTFAGEGPARESWERHGQAVTSQGSGISIEFAGWLEKETLMSRLGATDVVVMPSLWPEPFGLVGLEANRRGVPVVAFATGGIPEWLQDGVNGCLAPGDPPTADGLADALIRCIRSLESSDALTRGALAAARSKREDAHLDALVDLLGQAARRSGCVSA
jgi:glycosyltransferase involved in cell wall biosynthesis